MIGGTGGVKCFVNSLLVQLFHQGAALCVVRGGHVYLSVAEPRVRRHRDLVGDRVPRHPEPWELVTESRVRIRQGSVPVVPRRARAEADARRGVLVVEHALPFNSSVCSHAVLFDADKSYFGPKLVYMGDSKFCLVESRRWTAMGR
jgi:hypothetical protein